MDNRRTFLKKMASVVPACLVAPQILSSVYDSKSIELNKASSLYPYNCLGLYAVEKPSWYKKLENNDIQTLDDVNDILTAGHLAKRRYLDINPHKGFLYHLPLSQSNILTSFSQYIMHGMHIVFNQCGIGSGNCVYLSKNISFSRYYSIRDDNDNYQSVDIRYLPDPIKNKIIVCRINSFMHETHMITHADKIPEDFVFVGSVEWQEA